MRLKKLRVLGFQSFGDSGDIEFDRGINLIVGQNNSGKSALLRALRPRLVDDRHRRADRFRDYELPAPEVQMDLEMSGAELREAIFRSLPDTLLQIPVPRIDALEFGPALLQRDQVVLELKVEPHAGVRGRQFPAHALFESSPLPGSGGSAPYRPRAAPQRLAREVGHAGGELLWGSVSNSGVDDLPDLAAAQWRSSMFYFNAERYSVSRAPHGHAERLDPDARNLPTVLQTLSGSRGTLFLRLVEHLREIFPTVGNLSVRPFPDDAGVVEVRVWPTKEMHHPELSFALENSGTGVAQVVALLTAIMTMEQAVIIVDEINSFLHPAAVKALLRLLQTHYDQHQYIITTHSPEVIGFSNPSRIHLVRKSGYDSVVEAVQLDSVESFREVASHLGVSMSDVFAADRVVWLEGQTEELCLPYVHTQLVGPLPRGLLMLAVAATGDFIAKKRDREIVYEVYSRLVAASSALNIPVAFSFDMEALSDSEMEDMQRQSGGRIHFLPRRHFESFLLDADAVADFIRLRIDGAGAVGADEAAAKLAALAGLPEFQSRAKWAGSIEDETWLKNVDAAKLIARAIAELSEQRVTFGKKKDSLQLLKYLVEHKPARLAPLREYVTNLVRAVSDEAQT